MTMATEKNRVQREESAPERIRESRAITPAVDIYENNTEILLIADVPGVNPDGLNVHLENGELTIEASRSAEMQGAVLVQGYQSLDYLRVFKVPNTIDAGKIAAELKNGVLNIHLPKVETLRPRRIEVKSV
jgi:HSP20 family protein